METTQDWANVDNEPHQAPKALNGSQLCKMVKKDLDKVMKREIQD
jgi:hypothetical protein